VYVVSLRPKLSSFIFLMLSTSRSMATWSKDFLLEFTELFRQEECLWKVKSKDYYSRSKKDSSYGTLIGKVQEVEPDAMRDTVVKKINTLRRTFRKEHKRVIKSQVSGAGAEETYAPRLWYYNQLPRNFSLSPKILKLL